MAEFDAMAFPYCMEVRRKLGPYPSYILTKYACGLLNEDGYALLLEQSGTDPEFGIYQMRHTKYGKRPVRLKFYTPGAPTYPGQLAAQDKFRGAMVAWHALTTEQQSVYNKNAVGKGMQGMNLFIREYFRINKPI